MGYGSGDGIRVWGFVSWNGISVWGWNVCLRIEFVSGDGNRIWERDWNFVWGRDMYLGTGFACGGQNESGVGSRESRLAQDLRLKTKISIIYGRVTGRSMR